MEDPLFVRGEMLSPESPPLSQIGIYRWGRENLFSGPGNTLLTLLAIYVVYFIVTLIGPWLTRAVWDANSLSECRSITAAKYGPGIEGACFALIRERLPQFLFGFYPRDLYWRPILTFALLLVAIAPVLFNGLPRKMLWFSAIFPAVGFWLLWGGSVWFPATIMVGLCVAFLIGRWIASLAGMLFGSLAMLIAFMVIFLNPLGAFLRIIEFAIAYPLRRFAQVSFDLPTTIFGFDLQNLLPLRGHVQTFFDSIAPIGLRALQSDDMGGFLLSLIIGVSGIAFSLPLGILLALGRQSDMPLVRMICVGFIEAIRGVPLITLLFTASLLLNYFLPPGTNFDIILRVIIMVTLFSAAYMAEVIRGGLAALPRGQFEAADALGLNYWQAQQYIVMPQALKISIPSIVGNFIGLFKDTTLVIFIGLQDPLALISAVRANTAWNGTYWEPIILVGGLFFIVCFSMSRYAMYLERKLKTDHR